MKATDTTAFDVKMLESTVFDDVRSFFFENLNHNKNEEIIGYSASFVQDNHTKFNNGVLRGPHYPLAIHDQEKQVGIAQGALFDVATDIRKPSPIFGQWVSEILSIENKTPMWAPEGFVHGHLSLVNNPVLSESGPSVTDITQSAKDTSVASLIDQR